MAEFYRFPESFIDEVTERNDIEDVVGEYVTFTRNSGSNRFGLCPFHSEKTGSFSVNTSRQIYHCFGCHKGGGVISFIMDIENLSYPEAVEHLAKRAGLKMPEAGGQSPESKRRARILEANKAAAHFFVDTLYTEQGKDVLDYLKSRGISQKTAKRFGLGAAPKSSYALQNELTKQGFTREELLYADLIRKGDNGYYDTFRDRLIFPVIDTRKNVLAFSGRALNPEAKAKYLNSSDTFVYKKGRNLFALNLAKNSKADYFLLVEGNIDVTALHQAGFDSAVASLGTALTAEQARLLSNYKNKVIVCYDGDNAGQRATDKAIKILDRLDVETRILTIPGGMDPDEFIKARGSEAFCQLISGGDGGVDYKLKKIIEKYPDRTNTTEKLNFLKEATSFVAELYRPLERNVYAEKVAALAGVDKKSVEDEVDRIRRTYKKQKYSNSPVQAIQPAERKMNYADPASAMAEEGIIRIIYKHPDYIDKISLPEDGEYTSLVLGKIQREIITLYKAGQTVDINHLTGRLEQGELSHLINIIEKPETDGSRAINDYLSRFRELQAQKNTNPDLRELAESLRNRGNNYGRK